MTGKSDNRRSFVRLPADWIFDEQLLTVSLAARGLFIGMVTMSYNQQSYGRLTRRQVYLCAPGRTRLAPLIKSLLVSGLLVEDTQGDAYWIASASQWGVGGISTVGQPSLNSKKAAGQDASAVQNGSRAPARAPARGRVREREEKRREEVSFRSPSGSDRNDTAQAAPRDAESAAQPAPGDLEVEGDSLPEEILQLSGPERARAALANAPNSRASGTPTQMFRYPRKLNPIVPGNSLPVQLSGDYE